MSILREAIERKAHWLYLIDSGNQDDVYKIGITGRTVEQRLEEIQTEYTVPLASITKRRKVIGETAVLKLEHELHTKYQHSQDSTYGGCEWFCLEPKDLTQLKTIYDYNPDRS